MFNFNEVNKGKILGVTGICVLIIGIAFIIGSTYALDTSNTYTIVFNRAEDTEVMKTCQTDEDGKLDSDCISVISDVCSKWSLDSWDGSNTQGDPIKSSNFANMIFDKDTDYYCVAGSSKDYDMACYECKDDENIMHWAANGDSDKSCASGYIKTDKTENECKPIVYNSCYVCNDENSNIVKWDDNGEPDGSCASGYSKTDKEENECKPIVYNSCYVCNDDNSDVMKWDDNGEPDSSCSSGYYKINANQSECKPVENPPTGENILMAVIWFVGLGCLGYSLYYFKKINVRN